MTARTEKEVQKINKLYGTPDDWMIADMLNTYKETVRKIKHHRSVCMSDPEKSHTDTKVAPEETLPGTERFTEEPNLFKNLIPCNKTWILQNKPGPILMLFSNIKGLIMIEWMSEARQLIRYNTDNSQS